MLIYFIIKIEIEERSEAFEVFERTNARGKGLEVSDLLKNYIFSQEENIIEDKEFTAALKVKNRTMMLFLISKLAVNYNAIPK